MVDYERFDVYLIDLNPTVGKEINETRPCVIVSSDVNNRHSSLLIVAPLTSRLNKNPSRVKCRFEKRDGMILLDQLRSIDKRRLRKRLGRVTSSESDLIVETLLAMFAK